MVAHYESVYLNERDPVKVVKLKVKEGSNLTVGQIIFQFEPGEKSSPSYEHDSKSTLIDGPTKNFRAIRSTSSGLLKKLHVKEGDILHHGALILEFGSCSHPIVMKDMCAECGTDLRENLEGNQTAALAMVHNIPELRVSMKVAHTLGSIDEERLLQDKKLVLLVDLDQTLIHTTSDEIPRDIADVFHFKLQGSNSSWYHTRLRPFTKQFLGNISRYYELHICTFGSRTYAHTIAKFLDEEGRYFSHRILSRDECFSAHSKTANLKDLFPCGDHMVVIIDDREDVWNFAPNMIRVRPYHFFQHTGDINAPPGLAKQEKDEGFLTNSSNSQEKSKDHSSAPVLKNADKHDLNEFCATNDNDDYLLYLEDILCTIHREYYQIYDNREKISEAKAAPDMKIILPNVRRKVLETVCIVFSGVMPTNMPFERSKPYLAAKGLGATIVDRVTEATTHVIAASMGTAKLLEAKKYKHIQVVTPDWLWSCAERWEHVDERLFPLSSSSITLSNNFPMKESRKDMTTDGSAGRLGRKRKETTYVTRDNRQQDNESREEETNELEIDALETVKEVDDLELCLAAQALERELLNEED